MPHLPHLPLKNLGHLHLPVGILQGNIADVAGRQRCSPRIQVYAGIRKRGETKKAGGNNKLQMFQIFPSNFQQFRTGETAPHLQAAAPCRFSRLPGTRPRPPADSGKPPSAPGSDPRHQWRHRGGGASHVDKPWADIKPITIWGMVSSIFKPQK